MNIDVTSSTTVDFTYILDVDPYNRKYNCLDPNDNTEKEWNYNLSIYSNPMNIYKFYQKEKSTGEHQLLCIRKGVITNSYVGSILLDIKGKY